MAKKHIAGAPNVCGQLKASKINNICLSVAYIFFTPRNLPHWF
jgi:hypothetical protein